MQIPHSSLSQPYLVGRGGNGLVKGIRLCTRTHRSRRQAIRWPRCRLSAIREDVYPVNSKLLTGVLGVAAVWLLCPSSQASERLAHELTVPRDLLESLLLDNAHNRIQELSDVELLSLFQEVAKAPATSEGDSSERVPGGVFSRFPRLTNRPPGASAAPVAPKATDQGTEVTPSKPSSTSKSSTTKPEAPTTIGSSTEPSRSADKDDSDKDSAGTKQNTEALGAEKERLPDTLKDDTYRLLEDFGVPMPQQETSKDSLIKSDREGSRKGSQPENDSSLAATLLQGALGRLTGLLQSSSLSSTLSFAGLVGVCVLFVKYLASDDGLADESSSNAAESSSNGAESPSTRSQNGPAPASTAESAAKGADSTKPGEFDAARKKKQEESSEKGSQSRFDQFTPQEMLDGAAKKSTGLGEIFRLLWPAKSLLKGVEVAPLQGLQPEANQITKQMTKQISGPGATSETANQRARNDDESANGISDPTAGIRPPKAPESSQEGSRGLRPSLDPRALYPYSREQDRYPSASSLHPLGMDSWAPRGQTPPPMRLRRPSRVSNLPPEGQTPGAPSAAVLWQRKSSANGDVRRKQGSPAQGPSPVAGNAPQPGPQGYGSSREDFRRPPAADLGQNRGSLRPVDLDRMNHRSSATPDPLQGEFDLSNNRSQPGSDRQPAPRRPSQDIDREQPGSMQSPRQPDSAEGLSSGTSSPRTRADLPGQRSEGPSQEDLDRMNQRFTASPDVLKGEGASTSNLWSIESQAGYEGQSASTSTSKDTGVADNSRESSMRSPQEHRETDPSDLRDPLDMTESPIGPHSKAGVPPEGKQPLASSAPQGPHQEGAAPLPDRTEQAAKGIVVSPFDSLWHSAPSSPAPSPAVSSPPNGARDGPHKGDPISSPHGDLTGLQATAQAGQSNAETGEIEPLRERKAVRTSSSQQGADSVRKRGGMLRDETDSGVWDSLRYPPSPQDTRNTSEASTKESQPRSTLRLGTDTNSQPRDVRLLSGYNNRLSRRARLKSWAFASQREDCEQWPYEHESSDDDSESIFPREKDLLAFRARAAKRQHSQSSR